MSIMILVVEDNADLLDFFRLNLELAGYRVTTARHGLEAQRRLRAEEPDLLILDLGLPLMDGFAVLEWLRGFSDLPVIILTAWDGDEIVRAFNLGIDDYVAKPVSSRALLARVRMVAGTGALESGPLRGVCRSGDLLIDFEDQKVYFAGEPVRLSRTEFRLLKVFADHIGQTLEHQELVQLMWEHDYDDDTAMRQIDHQLLHLTIHRLCQSIEPDPGNPVYIIAEPGVGYRLQQH
ncbi:MAG: response regulator transcription factor [Anaerolineae bacterium]|nr:response regulator transcription factor [Anaerolineae bacterium]